MRDDNSNGFSCLRLCPCLLNITLIVAFLGMKRQDCIEIKLFYIEFPPKKSYIKVFDAKEKNEPTGIFTMTGKREQSLRREIRQR